MASAKKQRKPVRRKPVGAGISEASEILDALGDQIAVVDQAGIIVAVNAAWRRFAAENGADSDRLSVGCDYLASCRDSLGRPLPEAAEVLAGLEAVLSGRVKRFILEYPCHCDRKERWFTMEATRMQSGKGAVISHRNIAAQSAAIEAEREARALFSALFHGTIDAMFLCDLSSRSVCMVNSAFANLFGIPASELVERKFSDLRGRVVGQILRENNSAIVASGKAMTFEVTETSGTRTYEVVKGLHARSGGAQLVWGCVRDVSAARTTEQKFVETTDHERQHLGALLHEGPCQAMSGIWLYTNTLAEELTREGNRHAEDARQIAGLAREAGSELKQVLKDFLMDPVPLDDDEGFLAALAYLAEHAASGGDTRCTLCVPETIRLGNQAVRRHLFRIAQEAVRNATKHSQAKRLEIKLSETRRTVVLRVQDDGIGFNPKPQTSSGIGLQVMNYRARAIGAELEIRRLPKRGTAVTCTLPR